MIYIKDLLLGATMRMSHIPRFSAVPVNHRESVAEHTFYVCLYADRISMDCMIEESNQKLIYRAALWHDIEEVMTGDFIRSFKYSDREMKLLMDKAASICAYKVMKEIERSNQNTELLMQHWYNAKSHNTVGLIVKFADLLSVVSYMCKEAAMGNLYIQAMMKGSLPEYVDTFRDTLMDRYVNDIMEVINGDWASIRITN